jgi:integrase/recombinase XerC
VLNRVLKPAAKRAGLAGVSFHTLRHTANTLAESAGISTEARMKFMGHADAKTNARYTHPEASAFTKMLDGVQKPGRIPDSESEPKQLTERVQ